MIERLDRRRPSALQLGLAAATLIGTAVLFIWIAHGVATGGASTALDAPVATGLRPYAHGALLTAMLLVTQAHSTFAVACYAGLAAVLAWVDGHRRRLVLVVVCIGGGLLLNDLLKLFFQRARPVLDDPVLTLATYSFPSGHVAASTTLYALAVAWVFARTHRLAPRLLAVAGAALAIALVGFSRMFLGVHFVSDVGAALAEGIFWVTLCLLVQSFVSPGGGTAA